MQSATLSRIKTPPMMIGLFLAGLLLFAVVGVVRNVTSMTTAATLQSSVAAGLQSVQAQPTAIQPLPAFSLSQSQPAVYSVTANEAGPLTVDTPEWLAVKRGDQIGERKVFAGWWVVCADITTDGRWVGVNGGGVSWAMLTPEQRTAVVQRCMQEDVSLPLPNPVALPTATPMRPQWLDVTTDSSGGRWVWIGEFYVSCGHITPDYVYHNDRDVEAVAAWNRLPFDNQDQVRSKCHE